MKYIVLIGNPIDGMVIYGPFDSVDAAVEWSNSNVENDWFVTVLNDPASQTQG